MKLHKELKLILASEVPDKIFSKNFLLDVN